MTKTYGKDWSHEYYKFIRHLQETEFKGQSYSCIQTNERVRKAFRNYRRSEMKKFLREKNLTRKKYLMQKKLNPNAKMEEQEEEKEEVRLPQSTPIPIEKEEVREEGEDEEEEERTPPNQVSLDSNDETSAQTGIDNDSLGAPPILGGSRKRKRRLRKHRRTRRKGEPWKKYRRRGCHQKGGLTFKSSLLGLTPPTNPLPYVQTYTQNY